jgi:hypothetical protein
MRGFVLLDALLRMNGQADYGGAGSVSLILTMTVLFISVVGALYTMYALLGYTFKRMMSVPFIVIPLIPFAILTGIGLFGLLFPFWLSTSNGTLLSRSGVLPLFETNILYWNVIVLVLAFATVCAFYIVSSQRMLTEKRTRRTWIIAMTSSCGLEIAAALFLLFASLARLAGLPFPITQDFVGRLFFYFAVIVMFKLAEQAVIIVCVELFGVRRFHPVLHKAGAASDPLDRADFGLLKKLVRRQCGFLPLPFFILSLASSSMLLYWLNVYKTVFGLRALLAVLIGSGSTIILPFWIMLFAILLARSVWFLFPGTHPLLKSISKQSDPNASARQLLKEYKYPYFKDGDIIATPNFLILESFVLRAFYLPSLIGVGLTRNRFDPEEETEYVLYFADGQELMFRPDRTRLFDYMKEILYDNEMRVKMRIRTDRAIGAILLLLAIFAAMFLTFRSLISVEDAIKPSVLRDNMSAHEEVVALIGAGDIDSDGNAGGVADLPKRYASLSTGGRVRYEMTYEGANVFFYKSLNLFGDFIGFAYISGGDPQSNFAFIAGELSQAGNLGNSGWFYIEGKYDWARRACLGQLRRRIERVDKNCRH